MPRTCHAPAYVLRLLIYPGLEQLQALFFFCLRDLVRVACCRRAGPFAVDETERLVETDLRDQVQGGLEVRVGFTGETDDKIGRDTDIRSDLAQLFYPGLVLKHGVPPFHQRQDAVRSALHGQMQVVDEFRHTGINIDKAIGKFDRMRCGVTDTSDTVDRRDVLNQVGQVGSTVFMSGAAVGIHVLAEQGDFPDALCGKLGRLGQDIVQRPRYFLPACVRHYAERTVFAAPFHDGNEGNRTVCPGFGQAVEFFNFGKGDIDRRPARTARLVIESGQAVQGLRAEYDVDERRTRMNS